MPKEKEGFREMLVRLDERFPDTELLMKKDVAQFAGCDPKTVNKLYGKYFNHNRISKVQLARIMC